MNDFWYSQMDRFAVCRKGPADPFLKAFFYLKIRHLFVLKGLIIMNDMYPLHTQLFCLFRFSLVWRCSIWSWVKERGCKALTPTVSSWTTIDGKMWCQWCKPFSPAFSNVALFPVSLPLCFILVFFTLTQSMCLFCCCLPLIQDWVGVLGDEGVAQRPPLISVPSPLHPSQPALPLLALRGPTEAGAATGQATVSYSVTWGGFGWASKHK